MIFAADNRIYFDVSLPEQAPVVRVLSFFANNQVAQGSGVMIGANDVLTAAHVIYDTQLGWATQVLVLPAQHQSTLPFGAAYAAQLSTPSQWRAQGSLSDDYGLITTDVPIGYYTDWVQVANPSVSPVKVGDRLFSVGYPGELPVQPYYTNGSVDALSSDLLFFLNDMDATAGQSGSGVFNAQGNVVGIISHQSAFPDRNAATYLNESVYTQVMAWASANDTTLSAPPKVSAYAYDDFDTIYRLYQGLFKREPDLSGLDYWLNAVSQRGFSLVDMADSFLKSIFDRSPYLDLAGEALIDALYENILGRSADASGKAYWLAELDAGSTLAMLVPSFVNSTEFMQQQALNAYSYWHSQLEGFARELLGTGFAETLIGSDGNDFLQGYAGNDELVGGSGNDYLMGGAGDDWLQGGAGRDFFAVDKTAFGRDTIVDFSLTQDYIRLRDGDMPFNLATTTQGWLTLVYSDEASITLQGVLPSQYEQIVFV